MNLEVKPRFFVFLSLLILGGAFGVYKLMGQGSPQKSVLAASDSYQLIDKTQGQGSESLVSQGTQGSSIETYQPVTISYTVKEGDTLQSIADTYHADPQTIADFPNNGLQESLQLKVGQILIIPNGYVDESQKPPPPPIAQGTGRFMWPVVGVVTQYAYSWHPGAIDIGIPLRTPVQAADDGTVKTVEYLTTGYGIHVIIDHGDGLTSLYGHLSEIKVVQGQGVHKGDVLGLSGSTGHSTGPHLHFEVRRGAAPVDPMTLLPPQ